MSGIKGGRWLLVAGRWSVAAGDRLLPFFSFSNIAPHWSLVPSP